MSNSYKSFSTMKKAGMVKLYETKTKWYPEKRRNACAFCGCETKKRYIATGHDHTDYDYDLCGCTDAKKAGKPEHECN